MSGSLITLSDLHTVVPLIFGGFFGSFGVVIGLWLRRKTKRFLQTAVETTGIYVKVVRKTSADAKGTSYRVVEFRTEDGEKVHYRAMTGVPWVSRSIGDSVPMLYDPARPEFARINSPIELVLPWLIFLLVGTGILLVFFGVTLLMLFAQ